MTDIWTDLNGPLERKIARMREAITGSAFPVTTWHGDPVCEKHLNILTAREVAPLTVRMAQWGRQ